MLLELLCVISGYVKNSLLLLVCSWAVPRSDLLQMQRDDLTELCAVLLLATENTGHPFNLHYLFLQANLYF